LTIDKCHQLTVSYRRICVINVSDEAPLLLLSEHVEIWQSIREFKFAGGKFSPPFQQISTGVRALY